MPSPILVQNGYFNTMRARSILSQLHIVHHTLKIKHCYAQEKKGPIIWNDRHSSSSLAQIKSWWILCQKHTKIEYFFILLITLISFWKIYLLYNYKVYENNISTSPTIMKFATLSKVPVLALSSSIFPSQHGVYGGKTPPTDRLLTSKSNKINQNRLVIATTSSSSSSTESVSKYNAAYC